MATEAEITTVRENVDEPTEDTYTNVAIGLLIDAVGVDSASAAIWRKKAATYAKLVTQSEAGASVQLSDLFKNATAMAKMYETSAAEADAASNGLRRAKVHKIVRVT